MSDEPTEEPPQLCDFEWIKLYSEHVHVCILRDQHEGNHRCECRTIKKAHREAGQE